MNDPQENEEPLDELDAEEWSLLEDFEDEESFEYEQEIQG